MNVVGWSGQSVTDILLPFSACPIVMYVSSITVTSLSSHVVVLVVCWWFRKSHVPGTRVPGYWYWCLVPVLELTVYWYWYQVVPGTMIPDTKGRTVIVDDYLVPGTGTSIRT